MLLPLRRRHVVPLLVLSLVTGAQAMPIQDPTLTVLTLNVCRFGGVGTMKAHTIIELILTMSPSVFVLTEAPVFDGPHVDLYDGLKYLYTFYTTPFNSYVYDHGGGGITVGVLSSIASQSMPCPSPKHDQNSIRIDIIIPDKIAGGTKKLAIVGVYAPQPSLPHRQEFWKTLTEALLDNAAWIALGDFNAVLDSREASANHSLTRGVNPYQGVLTQTGAVDLWSLQENIDLRTSYTCSRPHPTMPSFSVIDRICVSPRVPGGHIETLQTWIPNTDHKPVWSRLPVPLIDVQWDTTPRQRRLSKPENHDERFQKLQEYLANEAKQHNLARDVLSHIDFDNRYELVSRIFTEACQQCFERPQPVGPPRRYEPTREERAMRHEVNVLHAARNAIQSGNWSTYLRKCTAPDRSIHKCHSRMKAEVARFKIDGLLVTAQSTLASHRAKAVKVHATQRVRLKIARTVRTGSIKHLAPNQAIRIPPLIQDPADAAQFVTEPPAYMDAWRSHFVRILQRDSPPDQPKPWLNTPSAAKFRAASAEKPFIWPAPMQLPDLRALLARGKVTPAPGPDDWEKWALSCSGEPWLEVMVTLANYVLLNNYFPAALKGNYIVPIYRKGDVTNPSNYRGIVLANTLQIITASWFTFKLSNYVWDNGLIPNTQIAAQRNTSVGDMTHLLSAMDGFAKLKGEKYYALKRDQKKGFDYIHSSAYQDAARFFGLDNTLAFDQARTSQVQMIVKCRNMEAAPIYTDGQTKQGDPFSPLKYVLTTAMAFWWIADRHPDLGFKCETTRAAPILEGTKPRHRPSPPHQDPDLDSFYMQSVAAMDDTILFAKSEAHLQILTHDMEYFQTIYNMETDWTTPDKTTVFLMGKFDHADLAHQITLTLSENEVINLPLSQDRTFLKTPINNPAAHAATLTAIMKAFVFPRPGLTLPMTALRKIAEVVLAGRIQARLQMHPIQPKAAGDLITALNVKITRYFTDLRFASSAVLVAPIASGGLQFPDFGRLNSTNAIAALHRNLNSTNPTIKRAYAIMHSEWQCSPGNYGSHRCLPPLRATVDHVRAGKNYFLTWEVARMALHELHCCILPSPILSTGLCSDHDSVQAKQLHHLAEAFDDPAHVGRTMLQIASAATYDGRPSLRWATDGSAQPNDPARQKRASFAVVGPVSCTGKVKGHSVSILDAEIMAIATAVNLDNTFRRARSVDQTVQSFIYTDQLILVRRILSPNATSEQIKPGERSRHFLRYLLRLLATRNNLTLVYHKAHSEDGGNLDASALHKAADAEARGACNREDTATYGPPMAHTDTYTLIENSTGPVHDQPALLLNEIWNRLANGRTQRSGNAYIYTQRNLFMHTQSAYTARVQHWTRSNALATPAWKARHNFWRPDTCALCMEPSENVDVRHIFLTCPGVQHLKSSNAKRAHALVVRNVKPLPSQHQHVALADALFNDHPLWVNGEALYWKGELPGEFDFAPSFTQLYNDLAGLAMTTTAAIWSKHVQHDFSNRREFLARANIPAAQPDTAATQHDMAELPGHDDDLNQTEVFTAPAMDPIHGFGNPDMVEIIGDADYESNDEHHTGAARANYDSTDDDDHQGATDPEEDEYWDEYE